MKNHILITLVSLALVVFYANAAYANTNAKEEVTTAITHAGYADKMTDVKQIQLHLHHVINCLVGSKGIDFDPKAGDPCLHMGNGAINDFKGDKLERDMLSQALSEAEYGLMTHRTKIAHNAADLVEHSLKNAKYDN